MNNLNGVHGKKDRDEWYTITIKYIYSWCKKRL